ncbi:uncharacterized protein ColSpa_12120 [Colletotrichum spaethianum]|uniref:Uncharacterized protein n=1 Tax=Colletotrichum spaethianum TaxID=700344 RepID=A0AA37PGX7_9PEZI|nr:uncharacterized protein ColSpa_12120 [Colletotrichum spaethianum]GKT51939.1 hypothetical protein ColSpa_12120 [Colletotrichum spaethianum]
MAYTAAPARQRLAQTSDDTPSVPISSPSAQAPPPPPSDGRVSRKHIRDPNSWDPNPSSNNPFALIPAASYNTLAQLWPLTFRLLRAQWRLKWFLLPAQPGSPRQSDALHAFFTQVGHGRSRFVRNSAVVVFAILVNHVRRMVFPALGVGGFGAPIATLKLAVGSPEIFLREEMDLGILGRNSGWEGVWKAVGDVVGGCALKDVMVICSDKWSGHRLEVKIMQTLEGSHATGSKTTPKKWINEDDEWKMMDRKGREIEKDMVVGAVVYFVWVLGCAEYVHARAVHAVAVGIAYTKLLRGGPAHHQAMKEILLPSAPLSTLNVLGTHLELAYYIVYGLLPLLSLAATFAFRANPVRSRPELALLVAGWAWGTGYVTRYSNKYYIGLEMSGLLLVLWWISAAAAVFAWSAVRARFKARVLRV